MIETGLSNRETKENTPQKIELQTPTADLSKETISGSTEVKLLALNIKDRDAQIRAMPREEQFKLLTTVQYLETVFSILHVVGKSQTTEETKTLSNLLLINEKQKHTPIRNFLKRVLLGQEPLAQWNTLRPTMDSLPKLAIMDRYQLARCDDKVYNKPHNFYEQIFGAKPVTAYMMACAILVQTIESLRGIPEAQTSLLRFAIKSDQAQGYSVGDARIITRALEASFPNNIEWKDFSYVKGYSRVKVGKFRRRRTVQHIGWGSKINLVEGADMPVEIKEFKRSENKALRKLLDKFKNGVRS